MLELHHNNMSVCAQKVRLVLAEKGIEAVEHHLDLRAGDQQTPDYMKLNPKAVVPTLVHDGAVVTESTVIAEYLDEVFPEPPLRPADPAGRARMRAWAKRPDERIHAACSTVSNGIAFRHQWLARGAAELQRRIDLTPDPERRAWRREIIDHGVASALFGDAIRAHDKLLADMEKRLAESAWLAGEAYTLADVGITPYVNRLAMLRLERMWADRPNVADWYARVRARPNFAAAILAYDEDAYLSLMAEQGGVQWPAVAAAIEAA
jgi:glutathione S-transferase